jgi:acetyl esterase/lipase
VVCPGGGYQHLADHEGEPVARWANENGAAGLVLRYRLAPRYRHPAMLHDVLRALRTVRARADEWGLDPARVAVLGFSAGGHLASTAATLYDAGRPDDPDPVERQSSRPDAAVLVYPVITLQGPSAHTGSRGNLAGGDAEPDLLDLLSTDERVTSDTPPTFLVHSSDDGPVPVENSLRFAAALAAHKVPFAMQVYESGGHGYGMGRAGDPTTSEWPRQCAHWLRARGFFRQA